MGLLDDLDRRRQKSEQNRENSARLAQAYAVFTTTGQGTFQYEARVDFAITFTEQPIVSYGSALDIDDLANLLDIEDEDTCPIPQCSGSVINWDQDDRDFYTGCWVAVRVDFPLQDAIDPSAQPEVEHHFTFAAIAMKDIPTNTSDADAS
jgi:hypothetical protein